MRRNQNLNRITPNAPAAAYVTYEIRSPRDTSVVAACSQVGCLAYRYGWESTFDESTPAGRQAANYVRTRAGRTFREQRSGPLTVFRFESGQRCFAEHRTRPEVFRVLGGDYRGNPLGIRPVRHTRAADWVEDFGEHQDMVADARRKG